MDMFTRAYIEALYFTDTGCDHDIPEDAELAPQTLQSIIADCNGFRAVAREALERSGQDESQSGHDFWLTRNGHGVGFWDRGLGDVGDELTEYAHAYSSVDAYAGDDGLIYLA